MWLNKHYWSGSQTNQMNHSKRFFFWFVFLSAFDCPLFFLAKTFTQAHYWQPSIRLPLLDKWWNVVWFQAIPPSRICQCELHQKAPHKKKNREVCSLVLRIFARTNLSCGEILACLFHLRWVLGNTLWGGKMLLLPLRDIKWQWLPATCVPLLRCISACSSTTVLCQVFQVFWGMGSTSICITSPLCQRWCSYFWFVCTIPRLWSC